jgi:hypothetical protein
MIEASGHPDTGAGAEFIRGHRLSGPYTDSRSYEEDTSAKRQTKSSDSVLNGNCRWIREGVLARCDKASEALSWTKLGGP